jgi:hypothetical protein
MTPNQQKPIIAVMVSLILLCVMLISYIWFTETRYPLFGNNSRIYNEKEALEDELEAIQRVTDSVQHLYAGPRPKWEVSQLIADSLVCKTCAGVEKLNDHYYQLLGTFQTAEDARFLSGQLLKMGLKDLKIFRKEGLKTDEETFQ